MKDHRAMALDEKRFAGLGISSQTIRSLPKFERPEPCQLDHLSTQNDLSNLLNHEIKSLANNLPWKIVASSVAPGGPGDVVRFKELPFFPVCFSGHELWTDFLPVPSICKLSAS